MPYVGAGVKIVVSISKKVHGVARKGHTTLDKTSKRFGKAAEPLDAYASTIEQVYSTLLETKSVIPGLVGAITQLAYCYFQDGQVSEFDRMEEWAQLLRSGIFAAETFLQSLAKTSVVLASLSRTLTVWILRALSRRR